MKCVTVEVISWLMVSRPVCLNIKPQLGPKTVRLSDSCGFVDVGRPLWREGGSVIYNCCWPLLSQSFSGPSPVGLVTIFYSLWVGTPRTWRTRSPHFYPPGTGWPSYAPRHWVPFLSLSVTCRSMVEVFELASNTGLWLKIKQLIILLVTC
jgi:hypothetical protein